MYHTQILGLGELGVCYFILFWGGGSNRPCMVQICVFKPFVDIKEGIGGIIN